MKKVFVLVMFFAVVFTAAAAEKGNKDVVGEWKYAVTTAPPGYEKGIMVFSEKEGKIAGEVKLDDGYKIDLKNVTYEGNTLKFGLYVDYEYITIETKVEEKAMTGTVNSPEGPMKLTAEKIK